MITDQAEDSALCKQSIEDVASPRCNAAVQHAQKSNNLPTSTIAARQPTSEAIRASLDRHERLSIDRYYLRHCAARRKGTAGWEWSKFGRSCGNSSPW